VAHIEDRWKKGGNRDRLRYRARYIAPDGRERSKSFARKADAKRWLADQEAAKVMHSWTDPRLGRTLFRDWHGEWARSAPRLRPNTEARDGWLMRDYVLARFGGAQLAMIGQRDVRAWLADLVAKGLAASTVHRAYQLLSKVMRAAVDAGMIARSPCHGVPLPRIEHEEMRFLTPVEIRRLAEVIDPRFRVLVLVACYGGLRIGELAGLRCSRVDLDQGTVRVVEIVSESSGHLHYGPPKTKASRRTVGLPRAIVKELATHMAEIHSPDSYVFPAPKGGPLRLATFRRRTWRPATRAAKLDGVRIHDMRHTAVSLWIAAGAGPKEVAARAGHTSVSFTLDRYGHLYPEADVALRDRLDKIIQGSSA
jgi:integrase